MAWTLEEAVLYYKKQGAPNDQTALIGLLREIQQEHKGVIPEVVLTQISQDYNVKESFLRAIIKRIPSLRLDNIHCLELCAGPNCSKHAALAAYAEQLNHDSNNAFVLRHVPCMRMCGKGPNVKWDGTLYHRVNPDLLRRLVNRI